MRAKFVKHFFYKVGWIENRRGAEATLASTLRWQPTSIGCNRQVRIGELAAVDFDPLGPLSEESPDVALCLLAYRLVDLF
jgi:hypothetical protein